MKVSNVKTKGTWREVADAANTTVNKDVGTKEPSSNWKLRMLLAEHSPIRQIILKWKWIGIKRWVSDHFVRHKFGIEHWVKTDRSDRTGIDRDNLLQSSLTNHEVEANTQAIINISRKRMCNKASAETRLAWEGVLNNIRHIEPELYHCCVPDCVYRGHCFEFDSCGFHKMPEFQEWLKIYRGDINK